MIAAILYSLIVMLSFGIANAVSKEMTAGYGAVGAIVLRNVFVVVLIALALVILRTPFSLDPYYLGVGVLIAFVGYVGFFFFMLALKTGKVGVVVPVASAQIIVASAFGFLALGDGFGLMKAATVALVFAGVALASVNFQDFRESPLFSIQSGIPYALAAALIWGFAFPLYKIPSDHLGGLFYGFVIEAIVLMSALAQTFFTRGGRGLNTLAARPTARIGIVIAVATIATALGTVFLNFAYQTGEISIVSAIYGSSSVVALITGALLYREVLSRQQYVGAVLVAIGIALPIFSCSSKYR